MRTFSIAILSAVLCFGVSSMVKADQAAPTTNAVVADAHADQSAATDMKDKKVKKMKKEKKMKTAHKPKKG